MLLLKKRVWQRALRYQSSTCRCCCGHQPGLGCSTGPREEGVRLTQPHAQKALRLFPALCKLRVTATTAILAEDEATKIHRTWKVEITILVNLRQHLLSMTKKIYELVPRFFS